MPRLLALFTCLLRSDLTRIPKVSSKIHCTGLIVQKYGESGTTIPPWFRRELQFESSHHHWVPSGLCAQICPRMCTGTLPTPNVLRAGDSQCTELYKPAGVDDLPEFIVWMTCFTMDAGTQSRILCSRE